MNREALIALLPLLAVAATAVLLMLAIALRRDFRLAFFLTLGGLLLALFSLPLALRAAPIQATELMLIDVYALGFCALVLIAAVVVALLSHGYFRTRENQNEEIFLLLLTASLGGMILVSSNHFAMFFLGLEILSVSLFPMIAYRARQKLPLEAGFKYLLLSGVASALLLFGMALIYGEFGVLSFRQLGQLAGGLDASPLAWVGAVLLVSALGFKLSLVPFHLWTPDVYEGAPAPVTAFVATVSKGAVFALLLRFWIAAHAYRSDAFLGILALIAIASILAGNLLALLQTHLKRMLGYSSIAHMGYLLAAFVAGSVLQTGLLAESVGFYLAAYVVTSLGAFGVVSALSSDEMEFVNLEDYRGLFWREPLLASILTANLLSLAGIPLTLGFIGKFYVFAAGVQAGLWLLVSAVVIGSGIGLYYYLRVIIAMLSEPETEAVAMTAPAPGKLALGCLTLVLLGFGVFPEPLIRLVLTAVQGFS